MVLFQKILLIKINGAILISVNNKLIVHDIQEADLVRIAMMITFTDEVQAVECSTTVNCSSNSTLMSARECCVNSVDGLSYSIPGQQQCHTCIGKGRHSI